MTAEINVNACAARINDTHYVIAEDWPTLELSHLAARTAASLLHPKSGYAGKRDLDTVADFVAGLLYCKEASKTYGCSILVCNVLDEEPTG